MQKLPVSTTITPRCMIDCSAHTTPPQHQCLHWTSEYGEVWRANFSHVQLKSASREQSHKARECCSSPVSQRQSHEKHDWCGDMLRFCTLCVAHQQWHGTEAQHGKRDRRLLTKGESSLAAQSRRCTSLSLHHSIVFGASVQQREQHTCHYASSHNSCTVDHKLYDSVSRPALR